MDFIDIHVNPSGHQRVGGYISKCCSVKRSEETDTVDVDVAETLSPLSVKILKR